MFVCVPAPERDTKTHTNTKIFNGYAILHMGIIFLNTVLLRKCQQIFVWRVFREISLCTVFLIIGQSALLELRLGVKTIIWAEESEFRTPGTQKPVENRCVRLCLPF